MKNNKNSSKNYNNNKDIWYILDATDILGQGSSFPSFRNVTEALRANFGILLASKHTNT